LQKLGIGNVELKAEDAMAANVDERFDVIAVTASMPTLTDRFINLLKPGGRLFIVIGRPPIMEATLVRLHPDGSWTDTGLFETLLTPMIHADQPAPFVL
jgi:protein-L-isoaspartate(D-aspartate) O-methyltransferase